VPLAVRASFIMDTSACGAFGALLKRQREAATLSQEELAELAGLSAKAISALERGARRSPHPTTVRLLADALGLQGPHRVAFEMAAHGQDDPGALLDGAAGRADSGAVLPPLVGRVYELSLLDQHLAGIGPPVLVLAGEPGIGKTRLLRAAAAQAVSRGWRVLASGCERRGGQEPYAPLLGALQRHIMSQKLARQRTSLRGCAWLVRLLPELATGPIEPLPPWLPPPEQERRLMFEAVRRFVANVAGPAGTLLVLDDLQWAGVDGLELLVSLVHSASSLRLVGGYRDTEVRPQDPLAVTLADLAHAGLATQHTLAPLAPEDAARLLAAVLDGGAGESGRSEAERGLRARVVRRAGGVPFFVVSCAQALRRGVGDDALPWDVAHGIRQRVAAVPPDAQEVIGAAAIAGRVVARALLLAMGVRPVGEMPAALMALCQARLLEEDGEEAYHFPHDVIREVVEADLGAARRIVLHRQVAEALEQGLGEPSLELLAYHYTRGGAQDKALLYLERAGDRAAARSAYAAADGYYRELVERLDGLGRVGEAARVREKWGVVLRLVGRYDAALAALGEAAETYRGVDDQESLGRAVARMGQVHAVRGTPEEGVARIASVLETWDTREPSPGLAALYVALATLGVKNGHYQEQLAAAERAADLARVIGDDALLAQAERFRGYALTFVGRVEEGLQVDTAAVALAERVGDLESLCGTLHNMAHIQCLRGEFAVSRRSKDRALAVAERLGDPTEIAFQTLHRGFVTFWSGDWDQAWQDYERGAALSRQIGLSYLPAYALLVRGLLCYGEGRWEEAVQALEESSGLAVRSGDLQPLRLAQLPLAELDVREGRAAAAHARLIPLLDRPGLEERDVTVLLPTVAWAHLELGDLTQAAAVVAQAVGRARAWSFRPTLLEALRVQALLATRQERWTEAVQPLEEALALARSMPYPYGEARVHHVSALVNAQTGKVVAARRCLEAARRLFHRLGARKDVEGVEQDSMSMAQGEWTPWRGRA